MINIFVGLPGSGKTLKLARLSLSLLKRNNRYYKKSGIIRKVYSNIKYNCEIEKKYGHLIHYWTELDDIWQSRNADIIWQEMGAYLDSNDYKIVPRELKRWLQLHRHYGIDIYGDTQDFPMIDISVRRITNHVFRLIKIFGTRDKSATRPEVKRPFGMILNLNVDTTTFAEDKQDYKYTGWKLDWITPKICKVFDSYTDLNYTSYPPLKHIERTCLKCGKIHLQHS